MSKKKKNAKPESYVAAFVYYAESDEEAELERNPSIPLLLELMNELHAEELQPEDVLVQVVEDALVVGTEDGQRAGVILIHTIQREDHDGCKA